MTITGFSGRIAVVTGAAGSMGSELSRALLAQGARVAGIDRLGSSGVLGELQADYPETFLGIEADVADQANVKEVFARVDDTFGPVQHLVNLAGITGIAGSILDATKEEIEQVFAVNFDGTVWTCQEALLRMIRQNDGVIVNISSTNGIAARRKDFTHIYAGAKAAVIGFTRSLAAEAAGHNVRVNCLAPGMHLGTMQQELMATSTEGTEDFIGRAIAFTPLGRAGSGADIVGPVLFLLGSDSSFMTGQLIVSDGGRSMWYE